MTPRESPTVAAMLARAAEQFGARPAYATRREGVGWDLHSFRELHDDALALAAALIELGLPRGGTVGLLSEGAYEWLVTSFGVALAGGADVPRAVETPHDELVAILTHAEVTVCFVQTDALAERIERARDRLPLLRTLFVMQPDPTSTREGLPALLTRGRELLAGGDRRAEERVRAVAPHDLVTVIYTSGTTGRPKGVELTHANLMSQLARLPIPVSPEDRLLSILPVWHAYERIFLMVSVSHGACTYGSSVRTLVEDLRAARPTLFASAPRLWESLHQRIEKKLDAAHPFRRRTARLAFRIARAASGSLAFLRGNALDLTGSPPAIRALRGAGHAIRLATLALPWLLADRSVLRHARALLGGSFRGTVSGGGALPAHVDRFFNAAGIPVLEGYGLTETSPVLAVRTFEKLVIGTVGPLFPDTECRIVDPVGRADFYPDPSRPDRGRGRVGEIVVRGPQVMRGYHRDPEATRQVLDPEGWFSTGDLGMVTFNDCLKIVGRAKDTIVLRNGENLEPAPLEARLLESPLVDQCIVVGQDQRFVSALVVGSLDGFAARGVRAGTIAELAAHPEAIPLLEAEVARLFGPSSGVLAHARPRAVRLLPAPFVVGAELTPTHKLRRAVIADHYRGLISGIYARDSIG